MRAGRFFTGPRRFFLSALCLPTVAVALTLLCGTGQAAELAVQQTWSMSDAPDLGITFLEEVRAAGDLPMAIVQYPLARLKKLMVEPGREVCAIALPRIGPHDDVIDWIRPITRFRIVAVRLKDQDPGGLDTARIGVLHGTAIETMALASGLKVEAFNDREQALKMLALGRVGYWAEAEPLIDYLSRRAGIETVVAKDFGTAETWAACNRAMDQELRRRFAATVQGFVDSGRAQTLFDKAHLGQMLVPPQ